MTLPRAASKLLERQAEQEQLAQAWREACAGQGSTWLVRAEAGGGKTRLLQDTATAGRALWGAAEPVSPPEPYLALTLALRGLRPAASRAETVTRVAARLEEASATEPLMLVLDDLHFADEGTIAVLVRLAMRCAGHPWLILAAFRPGEGADGLRLATTELVAQRQARLLDLAPLSRAGIESLAAGVRGAMVPAAEIDQIVSGSGGNPWLVETLSRGGEAALVARERILGRIERLDQALPGAARLLMALAPAGEPLPHDVVARLAGGDGRATRQLLIGLRDAGVLREERESWQFRHELLRSALLGDMIEAELRDAHRALAEALEGSAAATRLSMHYAMAGDTRAFTWALRAAEEASAIDAHVESLAQAQRARDFATRPADRLLAYHSAMTATFHLGRFGEGRRIADEALTVSGGEPEMYALFHRSAANLARLSGDFDAAGMHMGLAEQAIAGRPVSEEMVRLAVARILEAQYAADAALVQARAERALGLAQELEDREVAAGFEMEARSYVGLAQLAAGDPAGFAGFEAMVELGERRPELARDVLVGVSNGFGAAVTSLFHADAERYRERLEAGVRRHELGWQTWVTPYRSLELVQRGAYVEARALLAEGPAPAPNTVEHSVVRCATVLLEARAGSPDKARSLLSAGRWPNGFVPSLLRNVAWLEVRSVDEELGDQLTVAGLYERAARRHWARPAGMAAVILARSGAGAPPVPDWMVPASPLRVYWDWAQGIASGDTALLLDVASKFEAMQCPFEAALALRDAGDISGAYRALRALEAATAREQTATMLRATGQPVPRRPRVAVGRDPLTDMERTICRLVAAGETNEQIAQTLGIGARTVETHLTRLYQRTGRRGRGALSAWWIAREQGSSSDATDAR
jgi:DNA-binding CsgD family transcriptional regulator